MPSRILAETPPEPVPEAEARKPYYPCLYLTREQLGDIFNQLQVGDTREASFVVKVKSKSVTEDDDKRRGSVELELVSIELEEEEYDDMTTATVAAIKEAMDREKV